MSKNWYPVIDYEKCISCYSCVEFCPHGVYEIINERVEVTHPENCVDFCKGCLKGACTQKAISFVGDRVKIALDGGEKQ